MSDSLRPHELQHARPPSLSITNSWSSLRLMSIESVMPFFHHSKSIANIHLPLLTCNEILYILKCFLTWLHIAKYWYQSTDINLIEHIHLGEEQPHDWGRGRWLGGPTPRPRSRGCPGAGGPRGAIPHWRSGRAAVRRYPSSKVRSNGCALLEQPWRDTPRPR